MAVIAFFSRSLAYRPSQSLEETSHTSNNTYTLYAYYIEFKWLPSLGSIISIPLAIQVMIHTHSMQNNIEWRPVAKTKHLCLLVLAISKPHTSELTCTRTIYCMNVCTIVILESAVILHNNCMQDGRHVKMLVHQMKSW